MKIIIAGAGAVGTHLAKLLSGEKQDIILMDEDERKLDASGGNLDLMTVNASPTSISGLKDFRHIGQTARVSACFSPYDDHRLRLLRNHQRFLLTPARRVADGFEHG